MPGVFSTVSGPIRAGGVPPGEAGNAGTFSLPGTAVSFRCWVVTGECGAGVEPVGAAGSSPRWIYRDRVSGAAGEFCGEAVRPRGRSSGSTSAAEGCELDGEVEGAVAAQALHPLAGHTGGLGA